MEKTKAKKDGYQTVRLKEELTKEIDDIVSSELGKKYGLKSRADLVTRAVIEYLEEHRPRFQHLNMVDNIVRVIDFPTRHIAEIIFRENGSAYCELCRALDCEHIKYALEQEDIQKALKESGWTNKF